MCVALVFRVAWAHNAQVYCILTLSQARGGPRARQQLVNTNSSFGGFVLVVRVLCRASQSQRRLPQHSNTHSRCYVNARALRNTFTEVCSVCVCGTFRRRVYLFTSNTFYIHTRTECMCVHVCVRNRLTAAPRACQHARSKWLLVDERARGDLPSHPI